MRFDLLDTASSFVTLCLVATILFLTVRRPPFAALSLPSMTMITSLVYFFVMPVVGLASGDPGHFGIVINSVSAMHFAVLLYTVGAGAAFLLNQRVLLQDPSRAHPDDRDISLYVYIGFWVVAIAALVLLMERGKLILFGAPPLDMGAADDGEALRFLNQAYNLLIPLTLVALLRYRFNLPSILLALFVCFVFLQAGFRYRIVILVLGAVTIAAFIFRFRVGVLLAPAGVFIGIVLINLVGSIRRYGRGLDFSNVDGLTLDTLLTDFRGEIGPVYVFAYTAENPLPPPIGIDPWLIGVARLVPTAIWPDKPTPDYLSYVTRGTTDFSADSAGIAAPQHVEMLYQFGWEGLPILAFAYFAIAALVIRLLWRMGPEARIVGCAMAPAFFGYYMQSRGYFFQIFSDGLFMFGPLFLMYLGKMRRRLDTRSATRAIAPGVHPA
jgi:hypothetical protein